MEERTIKQVKIYKLLLNPMTDRAEASRMVAISHDRQKLIDWAESLKVETYQDGFYYKSFKKGSPLEWFNPLISYRDPMLFGQGIEEEWTTEENIKSYMQHAQNSMGFITVPVIVEEL